VTLDVDAILFDVDDTLYPYAPCNAAGLTAAHGVLCETADVTGEKFYELHDAVRRELAETLKGQAASHNRVLFFKRMVERLIGADDSALVLRVNTAYWNAFFFHMQPAPAMHDVLGALKARYKLALVSNHVTEPQLGKIARLGVEDYCRVIVTSEEVGVEKPEAAMFERALGRLDVSADRAVMVGDSDSGDVAGAKAAGLWSVRTTEFIGATPDAPPADVTIASLSELPAVVGA